MTMELRAMVMFYSALLGATPPARALKQGGLNKLNFVSIHVPVVRQHCTQMEGFAFSHII